MEELASARVLFPIDKQGEFLSRRKAVHDFDLYEHDFFLL